MSPQAAVYQHADLHADQRADLETLFAYLLHSLAVEEATTISDHVRRCHPCRLQLGSLREGIGLYARLYPLQGGPAPGRGRFLETLARRSTARDPHPAPVSVAFIETGQLHRQIQLDAAHRLRSRPLGMNAAPARK